MRVSASSRPTTDLPSVWPQRFGATWSSSMIAAKPARAYPCTVRLMFCALPKPVSPSPIIGIDTARQMFCP